MFHYLFSRIQQDQLLDGVVASLVTHHVAPVKGKPQGNKSPATTNVQKGMDTQDLNHILEQSGADSAQINLNEPAQVLVIALAAVISPLHGVFFQPGRQKIESLPGGDSQGVHLGVPHGGYHNLSKGLKFGDRVLIRVIDNKIELESE